MKGLGVTLCLLSVLGACEAHRPRARVLAPLQDEGELYVYLDPLPAGAERLAFTLESLSARRADGGAAAMTLLLPDVSRIAVEGQRLLAFGRLAPAAYSGLALKVKRATLERDGRRSDLLVSPEGNPVDIPFSISRRRATIVVLSLRYAASVAQGFAFAPDFAATTPGPLVPSLAGYCSSTGMDGVTVFDKHTRRVAAVIPTGREPQGVAVDARLGRVYVALSGEDQVQVLDTYTGEEVGRISLRPGDRPRELALTPDGRVLVVVNPGSNTASFLDAAALLETDRVQTGEEPSSLLLDRAGRRAYVLNRRSASVTILDLATHLVAGTGRTNAEPLRAALNRAGTRLYVIHGASPYLLALSLPDLSIAARLLVGVGSFGVSALLVDARTDLLYVGRPDEDRLEVYDPASLMPLADVDLPGPATFLAIDDAENTLFALVPSRRTVAAVDLVGGRALGSFGVGEEPYQVTVVGERR